MCGYLIRPSLSKFIDTFQIAREKIQEEGMLANVWEIAGLKRNEVRIAGVLNWLLDSCGSHGQKHRICAALLDSIPQHVTNKAKEISMSEFPISKNLYSISGQARYRAITEICPLDEQENRVDIELNGDGILLFIEVKIDANQGDAQLSRYHNIAQIKAQGRPWGMLYLTPTGILPEDARYLPNTVSLPWSDISTTFRNYADSMPSANLARHYIEQFARFVDQL